MTNLMKVTLLFSIAIHAILEILEFNIQQIEYVSVWLATI